jgi:hypothetical protein
LGRLIPCSRTCIGKIDSDANLCLDARLCTTFGYAGNHYSKTIKKKGCVNGLIEGVWDRVKPTYFEQDSFGGYTTVWEAKGFFLRGWEAGGGTGFVGEMGSSGGTIMTAEEGLSFTGCWDGEIEGEADAEV